MFPGLPEANPTGVSCEVWPIQRGSNSISSRNLQLYKPAMGWIFEKHSTTMLLTRILAG
jgi:hypothetical protein